ncbi:hypothetical protein [Phenylobacterium sp. SCN 70-31]|uniref:hypothetical protein n=1 Tax=Phenylobacterium sp. SCN 70-31 TaxID=1660129 RepID=UPI0025FC1DFA|nr:hypothetical protein [Phenylobacterium sp. SCN 70-31]
MSTIFYAIVEGDHVLQYPVSPGIEGCKPVYVDEQPEATETTRVIATIPVLENGVWRQGWTVENLTAEELQSIAETGYPRPPQA